MRPDFLRARFGLSGHSRELLRLRLGTFFTGTPLPFIIAVVGIAVAFRVGLGILRPAPEEPGPPATEATAARPD